MLRFELWVFSGELLEVTPDEYKNWMDNEKNKFFI